MVPPPAAAPAAAPALSVVVPAYDEADVLPALAARLRTVLDGLVADGVVAGGPAGYEVLVVDDGSTDATPVVLARLRRGWPQLRVVRLRANAGHQAALSAGLARARGTRGVVTMDADLQDPPELLPQLLAAGADADVVHAVRSDRSVDPLLKRAGAAAFYRLVRALGGRAPEQAGDYRWTSRAVVDAVLDLPERHRVLRLVVPALGFDAAVVEHVRGERAAGRSKYPLGRMVRLGLDAVTGASTAPLRLATSFGLGGAVATTLLLAYALVSYALGSTVPGWTSTVAVVAGVGTLQLLCLGVLGEYVGRLYVQAQGLPAYLVASDSLGPGEGSQPRT